MDINEKDLTTEEWREYEFGGTIYRIEEPQKIFWYKGSTTHRILTTDGVIHCVPAPGNNGCILRWKSKNTSVPVNF